MPLPLLPYDLTALLRRVTSDTNAPSASKGTVLDQAIADAGSKYQELVKFTQSDPTEAEEKLNSAWKRLLPPAPALPDMEVHPSVYHRLQMEKALKAPPLSATSPLTRLALMLFSTHPVGNTAIQGATLLSNPTLETFGKVGKQITEAPAGVKTPVVPTGLLGELKRGLQARLKVNLESPAVAEPLELLTERDPRSWRSWERLTPEEAVPLFQEVGGGKYLMDTADPTTFLQRILRNDHPIIETIKTEALARTAKENPALEIFPQATQRHARQLLQNWFQSPEGKAHAVSLDAPVLEGLQREIATGAESAAEISKAPAALTAIERSPTNTLDWIDPSQLAKDKTLKTAFEALPYSTQLVIEGAMQGKPVSMLRMLSHGKGRNYSPAELKNMVDRGKLMLAYHLQHGEPFEKKLNEMLEEITNAPGEYSAYKAKAVLRMKLLNGWSIRTIADKLGYQKSRAQEFADFGIKKLKQSGAIERYKELFAQ